jgi:putative flippase GtrA
MNAQPHQRTFKQLQAFGFTGVVIFLTNLTITYLMKSGLGFSVEVAYLAGYSSAILIGFLICRHAVFKATEQSPGKQLILFIISSIFFRGIEYGTSLFLNKGMEIHYLSALVVVAIASFFVKFFYYRSMVFRTK